MPRFMQGISRRVPRRLLERVEVREHLGRMVGRAHLGIRLGDLAVGRDEHRYSTGACAFIGRGAISLGHRFVGVAQKVVGEAELLLELLVGLGLVCADAEDDTFAAVEILDSITEPLAFDGSARGIGFGVPPQQHALAGKIPKRDFLAVLIDQREIGRLASFRDDGHASSDTETGHETADPDSKGGQGPVNKDCRRAFGSALRRRAWTGRIGAC